MTEKVVKTAIFKLHNISKRKATILEKEFRKYTLARNSAFSYVQRNLPEIYALYKENTQQEFQNKLAKLNRPIKSQFSFLSCHYEDLISDVAGSLSSYFELKLSYDQNLEEIKNGDTREIARKIAVLGSKPSLPGGRDILRESPNDSALLVQLSTCSDLEEENGLRDELERKVERCVPVNFSRTFVGNTRRGFCIAYDKQSGKYTLFLAMLPNGSKRRRATGEDNENSPKLVVFSDKGREEFVPASSDEGTNYLTFPLEMGDWHEHQFLGLVSEGKAKLASAKLVWDESGDYYVHVNVDFGKNNARKVKPKTVLGIDRGVNNICGYAIYELNGEYVDDNVLNGGEVIRAFEDCKRNMQDLQRKGSRKQVKSSKITDSILHKTANEIVQLALKHESQIVMEDLRGLSKNEKVQKKTRGGSSKNKRFAEVMSRTPYGKFAFILKYKALCAGLPKPITNIYPERTSSCCSECGGYHPDNRRKPKKGEDRIWGDFICQNPECKFYGKKVDADRNAAKNIAIRGLKYINGGNKNKKKKGA